LITFLFVVFFRPSVELLRRYRHNWQAKVWVFTVLEGTILFLVGWCGIALLNGSLPLCFAGYSHPAATALMVWLCACVLFLLSTFICSMVETEPLNTHTVTDELIDAPITDDSQDILGRISFVNDFYTQIAKFPSEDSYVFGLNGPWGSGKTSALNLLRNRIRRNKDLVLVDFDPWYFQSAETITRRFYETIAVAINREFFLPELKSIVRRYARILAPALKRYGIESIRPDDATVEEIKAMVEDCIRQTQRKVVIIIDDLERAHGDELLTTFQIVRLSANFKNTLFVLAYDQAQLLPQLARLAVPSDFLGKIVQHPADLPAADKNEIDRFLIYSDLNGRRSQLDKVLDRLKIAEKRREEFDRRSGEIYATTLSPFFPTLRNAKRFLVSFSVRLPVVVDEVCLLDFFLLEILRVFASGVYQDIFEKPHYYVPAWTMKSMMSSPFGLEYDSKQKDLRREEIKGHVEAVLKSEPQKENVLKILKHLFVPRIADAFGHPASYGDEAAAQFRAEKRLTHPECFDKYFLLSVPAGITSDASVEFTLASWLGAENREASVLEGLAKLGDSHRLVEVLDRILMFLPTIDNSLVIPLLHALSRNIKSGPMDADRSEQNSQFRLILFLLQERVPADEKQATTEYIIREIRPLDVAVRFVVALTSDQSAVTWGLRRSLDIARIMKLVQERFSNEFVGPGVDIFEANNLPLYVLFQIGRFSSESASVVNAYALGLLERKPSYIGQLIDAFLIEYDHGPRGFQFEDLKSVYDARRLAELAKHAGENAWKSDKQRRAIDTFLHLVAGGGSSEEPTIRSDDPA
jgi:KAP family P-loop domain